MHAFGDGNCFMPLVQDLLALYEAELGNQPPPPLQGARSFEVLERRLLDTLWCRQTPDRASFRGTGFRYNGRGYGHGFDLQPGMVVPLMRAAEHYSVPFDTTLLAMVACAMACVDKTESIELTLFAPMRDGPAEVTMIGLFSDWRDLVINVDFDLSTVLGIVLQLNYIIQNRKWTVYNALRKPDRTVVNMQLLDGERRSTFKQAAEHLFWGGDRFGRKVQRGDMRPQKQPFSFSID